MTHSEYNTPEPGDTSAPASLPRFVPSARTKLQAMIAMLAREQGATVSEIAMATGWQPHTTRAAMSGLKRKGYRLGKTRRNEVACYHLAGKSASSRAIGAGRPDRIEDGSSTDLTLFTSPAAETQCAVDAIEPRQPWPRLSELGANSRALARRRSYIGGSDANTILSANPERIHRLWLEKRGEEQPEDLSEKLPVMLGSWTEPFNRQWFERSTGRAVARAGEWVSCTTNDWRACTLDGYLLDTDTVWEAKHTSSFAKGDEILERYMPQLQHNMAVTGAATALLSVIFGNGKWECYEVRADWLYQQDLLAAEFQFWNCVISGAPPVPAQVPPPPKPVGVREICLEGNNVWAASAADWLMHGEAAKRHAAATAALKDMIEPDVSKAFGHGVEAKRSKAGAITIRALRP